MSVLAPLLGSFVDYAGLFPPAKLGMTGAVRHHADYLAGPHRALLGAFVLPLERLAEFEAALATLEPAALSDWRLNVLAGADPAADAEAVIEFNSRQTVARIVAVETKATNTDEVVWFTSSFPQDVEIWVELPPTSPRLPALLERVRATGRGAKLRTGGVTGDAFPSPATVARFLRECHRAGVVMKAAAGLHHPLRGDYPLTYETGCPRGTMFGFLNLLLAAALVRAGGSETDTIALLDERDARAFAVGDDAIAWRGFRFTAPQLTATRQALCRSFGSCSFTEPIDGLQELHWI